MVDQPIILTNGLDPSVAITSGVEVFDRALAQPSLADVLTLPVLEERITVDKRQVTKGLVRVSTRTETIEQLADSVLDRTVVDVTRIPIGRMVETAPADRTEGDTTIVSVVEERLVLVKQLFLTEELHIRKRVEQETVQTAVPLRRQSVLIERLDPNGHLKD